MSASVSRRRAFAPSTITVLHTCSTHGPELGTFKVQRDMKLSDGVTHRYSVTRCDGSRMDVYSDNPAVQVSE